MSASGSAPITVVLGDPRLPDVSKPGGRYTADDLDQVVRLRTALEELTEYRFDYWDDHPSLLERLRAERPAFVLNFCDTGFRNQASRELHLPAYLEMLDIPYSGSGPVALGLCYDKALVRAVAQRHGVPVPWERFVGAGDALVPALDGLAYPAFVKPNRGDGSVGITAASIVQDAREAHACASRLREALPGTDLLVQELLPGDEYGIGLIGNPGLGLEPLPALEIDYSGLDPSLARLLDYSYKTDPDSPYYRALGFRTARLPEPELARLRGWCEVLFGRLDLRDYARFDFRRDAAGEVKLMEVNPNPAWSHDGTLAHMASLAGEGHAAVLGRLIRAARRRALAAA